MLKRIVLFLISILLIFNFTACSSDIVNENNENDEEDSLEIEKDASLEVWIMKNSKNSQKDFMNLIKPFLRKNPHIKVNTTVIEWNQALLKITDAAKNDKMPDVVQLDMEWVAAISSLDVLADVSGVINTGDFVKASLDVTNIKGEEKITAVPWFLDTKVLFYRKDACEMAEVDASRDFSTWNTFKESLKKLNKLEIGDEEIAALGAFGGKDLNPVDDFSWWIYSAGGNFLNPDGTKSAFNSPKVLEGIKFYSELALEGLIDRESLEKTYEEVEDMFIEGKYATAFLALSAVNKLESLVEKESDEEETEEDSLTDNIGVAMVPAGPEGRVSFLGGSFLAVSKSSENLDDAKELIKFLASEDAQIDYAKVTGKLPALKKACENPFIKDHPMRGVFKEQLEYGRAYPAIPLWGPVKVCLNDAIKKIWDNVLNNNEDAYSFSHTEIIAEDTEKLINMVLGHEEEIEEPEEESKEESKEE
jgi:multiple sugar transport system substrate-binding protein